MIIGSDVIELCGIFFVLGWVYALVVKRLPEWTWPAWFVWSVFGITTVVTATYCYIGELRYFDLVAVFLSALPGIVWMNWFQWQNHLERQDVLLAEIDRLETELKKTENQVVIRVPELAYYEKTN